MLDVRVTGADKLVTLGRQLRKAGQKDLSKELRAALKDATVPVKVAIRQNALETMPKRGGLNEAMAKSRIKVQVRTSGKLAGVRLINKTHDTRLDSQGRLRHPVFGNRKKWAEQRVTPGWFTSPATRAATGARVQLLLAIKRIEKELERR